MRDQLTAAARQSKARPCPQCGADTPYDERFVMWCAACDWNVDPGGAEPARGRFEEMQRRLAHRYGEQLHAELLADPDAAKGRVAALRGHSVDATHPPTHLRRHLIEAGEPAAAAVVIDPGAAASIAAELAPARETVARAVIRDLAG
ncbi:hypothetical protein [Streptomyces sp. NBC_00212]|uniref:hypothetical protein n=1 Tax=Streptomyces sp. NBC_00212 TaxID=2975684 RepID=UPI00324EE60D